MLDPFTTEMIKHKLYGVVDEGFIALENISGTPVVAEGHDTIVALYTPTGDLLYSGAGVLHHVPCAAQAVKGVIDYFTEHGEIAENDVFMMNDPYSGALHAPDVFIIQPIHAAGTLVAFVASFLHVSDIGSIDPGGFCPNATESYHEGFQTKGLKLIEKGKLRQDVWDTVMNMTRVPHQVAMDYKSQIAAGFVAKQRMRALIEQYGVETVGTVGEELIQESEHFFRQRLLEIPDGVYRARKYFDLDDAVYRIELAATKAQDKLTFDFTGTDEQVTFGINACKWGAWGGLFPPIFTLLAWDMTWNDGILRQVEFVAPEGTLVNCRRPAPTSLSSIGVITMLNQMATHVVSKMLGTTEKYKNRATADWLGIHVVQVISGVGADGEYTVGVGTESFAGAGGGRALKDGVDNGGDITSITSTVGNMENFELRFPVRYLYRRVVPDSGGPGKYRGGCSHEYAQVAYGSPDNKFLVLAMPGNGTACPPAGGIFGGLPGCTAEWIQFRDGNIAEHPNNQASTQGKKEEYLSLGTTEIKDNDILYVRLPGGGGYGDPLDREPDLVLGDVQEGLVTSGPAHDIYGVVIDPHNRVDAEATRQRRLELRTERLGGRALAIDVSSCAPLPPSGRRLSAYLQVAGSGQAAYVQCTYCGGDICLANTRWKAQVPTRKVSSPAAGPGRKASPRFFLREFFCPSCATQLDTEVIYQDDPPLHDDISGWPEEIRS